MKCIGSRRPTSISLFLACALMICFAATLQAATGPQIALSQGISPIARFGQDLGRLPGNTPTELVAILNLQDEDGLRALIAAQNDPDSPSYHQFLTPEEFVQRFSPSPSAYDAVVSYFREHGFQVRTTPNRQLVIADSTATQVEKALQTELHRFYFRGKVHYANTSTPSLPGNLVASIRAIEGLDSREMISHMRIAANTVSASKTSTPAGYSPNEIATAYDFPLLHGWNGTGRTMAVASAFDFKDSDLQTFDSTFGITPAGYSRVFVKTSQGGNATGLETTVDVEYSTALGNGAFELVYLINSPKFSNFTVEFNRIVTDNQADVVTLSWGLCEQQQPSGEITQWDGILMQGAAQGQTWFVVTGDFGAFDCSGTLAVEYPASSPFVTACGGTALNLTSTGSIASETASSISGGGSSIVESQPSWEFGSSFFTNGKRWTADYSMDADPNPGLAIFQTGHWYVAYGTSFVGPYSAGLAASISQYKGSRLGLFAARLNQLANSRHLYPIVLHDITSGNNGYYSAGPGWDPPTGWGSPDGYMLMLNF